MTARSIHPFPAKMAPELALDYLPELEGSEPLTVLDPMCGSGTVLAAAASRGHSAIGIDIDPLAVLMSRVATSSWSGEGLEIASVEVVNSARRLSKNVAPWRASDRETQAFAEFWFGAPQLEQMYPLARAINALDQGPVREALQIALSRIVVTKSPKASLAGDTAHSRPHRVLTSSDFDVWAGFRASSRQLEALLLKRAITGTAEVTLGDSRALSTISAGTADVAITSPPYLNALDYLRGHKLSLIWLGYSIERLRSIRSASIGAERRLEGDPTERVGALRDHAVAAAVDSSTLPMGTITRYAKDMADFADEMARVLKPGARLVVVVGNSHLKGSPINNDGLTSLALEQSGFVLSSRTEREIPNNKRYLPIGRASAGLNLEKRMRTEIVLSLTAPA